MTPNTRKRGHALVETTTADGDVVASEGNRAAPYQQINEAIKVLQRANPEKPITRSHPQGTATAPKIRRPTSKPGDLGQPKRSRSSGNGPQEENNPEALTAIDGDSQGPSKKRRRLSSPTTIASTSKPAKGPTRKSSRGQRGHKEINTSNEQIASQPIEESQAFHVEPDIADQTDNTIKGNLSTPKKGRPKKQKSPSSSSMYEPDTDEAIDSQETVNPEAARDASIDDSCHARAPSSNTEDDLADIEIFHAMRTILKAGIASLDGEREKIEWIHESPKGRLVNEKIVMDLIAELEYIQESYIDLRRFKISGKVRDAREAEAKVRNSLASIIPQAKKLSLRSQSVLEAVYLHVIPAFIDAVTQGADAYTSTEPISTASLKEIESFLDSAHSFAEKAANKATKDQIIATKLQPLQKSIREIVPIIKKAQVKFYTEFANRQESEFQAVQEQRKRRIEKEKEEKREIEQLRNLAELQERKREKAHSNALHKRQWRALEAKLGDVMLSQLAPSGPARYDPRFTGSKKSISHGIQESGSTWSSLPLGAMDLREPARNEDYIGHDLTEREEHSFARLSNETRIAFVEMMRSELGLDRYAKTAEKFGWTIEEVFRCARDLQQAMDFEHENGNMDRPCDEWTYSIWIERDT